MANPPSWAVVSTMDEAPELTVAFAAYHLDLGASAVHIFLDRPDDPAADLLAQLPNCHVTLCTDAHWHDTAGKERPYMHTHRQSTNANLAFARNSADWLFHIDADEYLCPLGDWLTELATMPADHYFRVMNVERVRLARAPRAVDLFEGPFLRRLDETETTFLGADAAFYKNGFTGHSVGKSAVRRGDKMRLSIHRPRMKRGPRPRKTPPKRIAAQLALLHFEDITPLAWAFKRVRRMVRDAGSATPLKSSGHRQAQVDWLTAHAATGREAMAFFQKLCVLDATREAQLRAIDGLHDLTIDVQGALDRQCPQLNIDISPERFDAWLWETKGEMLEAYGFEKGAL